MTPSNRSTTNDWLVLHGGSGLATAAALFAAAGCAIPADENETNDGEFPCGAPIHVASSAALTAAIGEATERSCADQAAVITIANGTYEGSWALGAGIRLVGDSTAGVILAGTVTILPGEKAEIRRLTIAPHGGAGVWAGCGEVDCCSPAAPRTTVRLAEVLVRDAAPIGIALFGADATLDRITVRATQGTGLVAAGCAHVEATGLIVEDSAGAGVLFDRATGAIVGAPRGEPEDRSAITGSGAVGVWAQHPPSGDAAVPWLRLEEIRIEGSHGVGLGVSGADPVSERTMIICNVEIDRTARASMELEDMPSPGEVGYGILWKQGARIAHLEARVSGSAAPAALFDGPLAEPAVFRVDLGRGNQLGIWQQDLSGQSALTGLEGGPLSTSDDRLFGVPADLPVPSALP